MIDQTFKQEEKKKTPRVSEFGTYMFNYLYFLSLLCDKHSMILFPFLNYQNIKDMRATMFIMDTVMICACNVARQNQRERSLHLKVMAKLNKCGKGGWYKVESCATYLIKKYI